MKKESSSFSPKMSRKKQHRKERDIWGENRGSEGDPLRSEGAPSKDLLAENGGKCGEGRNYRPVRETCLEGLLSEEGAARRKRGSFSYRRLGCSSGRARK